VLGGANHRAEKRRRETGCPSTPCTARKRVSTTASRWPKDVSTRSVFVPRDELGLKHHVPPRSPPQGRVGKTMISRTGRYQRIHGSVARGDTSADAELAVEVFLCASKRAWSRAPRSTTFHTRGLGGFRDDDLLHGRGQDRRWTLGGSSELSDRAPDLYDPRKARATDARRRCGCDREGPEEPGRGPAGVLPAPRGEVIVFYSGQPRGGGTGWNVVPENQAHEEDLVLTSL
jgi:hypothetical protein